MKKLLLVALLFSATSAFATPTFKEYYHKDGSNEMTGIDFDYMVSGVDGDNCLFSRAKVTRGSTKAFTIKIDPNKIDGDNKEVCNVRGGLKGVITQVKKNEITKFKILGNNAFTGNYSFYSKD